MPEQPLTADQRAAMDGLARQFGAALKRHIAKKGPADRIDDIYQQTLLDTARALNRLTDPGKLHAVLFAIADRRCVDAFRSRQKHRGTPIDGFEWVVSQICTPPSASPSHLVAADEIARRARDAVAALNDEDRRLIDLFASGVPSGEIAKLPGWPSASALRHRLTRILKELRAIIEGGGG